VKPLEALRALGTGGEAPVEAKQRVYGALSASLGGAAATTAVAAAIPKATLPPVAAPTLVGFASSKVLLLGAGIWLTGGVTGAALYGAFQREQVHVVYVDRPTTAHTPAAPTLTPPQMPSSVPASSATGANVTRGARSAEPSSASSGQSDLARERALLDVARADAAHGEPALVLAQVERHLRQFPHGQLTEEREALAIRALLALARGDEARARATSFRTSYPNSFFMPVIDSALPAP
jgi:hypothetical protein